MRKKKLRLRISFQIMYHSAYLRVTCLHLAGKPPPNTPEIRNIRAQCFREKINININKWVDVFYALRYLISCRSSVSALLGARANDDRIPNECQLLHAHSNGNLILGKYFALHRIDFAHTSASFYQHRCVRALSNPYSHSVIFQCVQIGNLAIGFIRINKHKSLIIASMRHDTFLCVRCRGYIYLPEHIYIFDQIEFERKRELLFSSILICTEIAIRPKNLYRIPHYVFN